MKFILLTFIFSQFLLAQSSIRLEQYLSAKSIRSISASPNGEYVAITVENDNYQQNKRNRFFKLYTVKNLNAISHVDILKDKFISNIHWINDVELVFQFRDSIGVGLFSIHVDEPKNLNLIYRSSQKNHRISRIKILEGQRILISEHVRKDPDVALKNISVYPKPDANPQTVFRLLNFKTKKLDLLYSIHKNVTNFDVSPNLKYIAIHQYNYLEFYGRDAYENNGNTFLYDFKTGKEIRQLTNNTVWESFQWLNNETLIFDFNGDPYDKIRNATYNNMYTYSINSQKMTRFLGDYQGSINSITIHKNKMFIMTTKSTTNHFLYGIGDEFQQLTQMTRKIGSYDISKNGRVFFAHTLSDSFEELSVASTFSQLDDAVKVTHLNSELSSFNFPETETVSWKNSDGDRIEGVLMWPPGKKGHKNLPFVVDLHGGPYSLRYEAVTSSGLSYYYFASWLASKGYLVLQPNFRGSTGRGNEFMASINGYALSKPSDDILTGVDYLVKKGWVDKNRMVIKGASYGGHLTNFIIGQTTIFKAALSSCGRWSQFNYGTGDSDGGVNIRFLGKFEWDDIELYQKESPNHYIKNISTPTLITFGGKDVRVPTSNGYSMYHSLKIRGVDVEMIVYDKEGHLYRNPKNKIHKVKAEMAFIKKHID